MPKRHHPLQRRLRRPEGQLQWHLREDRAVCMHSQEGVRDRAENLHLADGIRERGASNPDGIVPGRKARGWTDAGVFCKIS